MVEGEEEDEGERRREDGDEREGYAGAGREQRGEGEGAPSAGAIDGNDPNSGDARSKSTAGRSGVAIKTSARSVTALLVNRKTRQRLSVVDGVPVLLGRGEQHVVRLKLLGRADGTCDACRGAAAEGALVSVLSNRRGDGGLGSGRRITPTPLPFSAVAAAIPSIDVTIGEVSLVLLSEERSAAAALTAPMVAVEGDGGTAGRSTRRQSEGEEGREWDCEVGGRESYLPLLRVSSRSTSAVVHAGRRKSRVLSEGGVEVLYYDGASLNW